MHSAVVSCYETFSLSSQNLVPPVESVSAAFLCRLFFSGLPSSGLVILYVPTLHATLCRGTCYVIVFNLIRKNTSHSSSAALHQFQQQTTTIQWALKTSRLQDLKTSRLKIARLQDSRLASSQDRRLKIIRTPGTRKTQDFQDP